MSIDARSRQTLEQLSYFVKMITNVAKYHIFSQNYLHPYSSLLPDGPASQAGNRRHIAMDRAVIIEAKCLDSVLYS